MAISCCSATVSFLYAASTRSFSAVSLLLAKTVCEIFLYSPTTKRLFTNIATLYTPKAPTAASIAGTTSFQFCARVVRLSAVHFNVLPIDSAISPSIMSIASAKFFHLDLTDSERTSCMLLNIPPSSVSSQRTSFTSSNVTFFFEIISSTSPALTMRPSNLLNRSASLSTIGMFASVNCRNSVPFKNLAAFI